MTRAQLQLDDDIHEALRQRAFTERKSISAVAREALRRGLAMNERAPESKKSDFTFVSSGASGRSDISVKHDKALVEDYK